ncbi:MAG TPA: DUF937 domain-containing protein [Xanthomonadaceae bacterium]|nr:DUF937 domain-containing protein [Xanthomonadaceae bacterium]
MATLSSDLATRLEGAPAQQIAERLGITQAQAGNAIATALPLLLGTLGHNASQPQGADTLFGALQEHRGAELGNVLDAALAGHGQGGAILGHVFGDRQAHADQALGQATGLGQDKAHLLLRWLAPLAMAWVARRLFDARHADAATDQAPTAQAGTATTPAAPSPQVLGDVLQRETAHAQQQHGGLLDAVLGGLGANAGELGGLLKKGEAIFGNRPTP